MAGSNVHDKHHNAESRHLFSSMPMTAKTTDRTIDQHDHHRPGNDNVHTKENTHMTSGNDPSQLQDHHAKHGKQSHGGQHSMYFHLSSGTPLLFEDWSLDSTGAIVGATIGIFIMTVLYEGLKSLRERHMREALKKLAEREQNACCNSEDQRLYIRIPILSHVLQTAMHITQVFLSYILMLAVMTYNVWLFFAVVLGSGTGYFVIGWFMPGSRKLSVAVQSDHCN